jgi:hypothetical protein
MSQFEKKMYEATMDYWCGRLSPDKIYETEAIFKSFPDSLAKAQGFDFNWRTCLILKGSYDYQMNAHQCEEYAKYINDMPEDELRQVVKIVDSDRKK